jgi:hypothetical protein
VTPVRRRPLVTEEKPAMPGVSARSWPYSSYQFSDSRLDANRQSAPLKPFTDAELGFRADEGLRDQISSDDPGVVHNAMLVQIARIGDRILKKLEEAPPATETTP